MEKDSSCAARDEQYGFRTGSGSAAGDVDERGHQAVLRYRSILLNSANVRLPCDYGAPGFTCECAAARSRNLNRAIIGLRSAITLEASVELRQRMVRSRSPLSSTAELPLATSTQEGRNNAAQLVPEQDAARHAMADWLNRLNQARYGVDSTCTPASSSKSKASSRTAVCPRRPAREESRDHRTFHAVAASLRGRVLGC